MPLAYFKNVANTNAAPVEFQKPHASRCQGANHYHSRSQMSLRLELAVLVLGEFLAKLNC